MTIGADILVEALEPHRGGRVAKAWWSMREALGHPLSLPCSRCCPGYGGGGCAEAHRQWCS